MNLKTIDDNQHAFFWDVINGVFQVLAMSRGKISAEIENHLLTQTLKLESFLPGITKSAGTPERESWSITRNVFANGKNWTLTIRYEDFGPGLGGVKVVKTDWKEN